MNHYASNMYRDKAGRHYWFAEKLKERNYDVTVFCANTLLNSDEPIDTEGKKQVVKQTDGIPFEVKNPNLSLRQAMDDVLNKRNLSKPYKNAKDAINAMLED